MPAFNPNKKPIEEGPVVNPPPPVPAPPVFTGNDGGGGGAGTNTNGGGGNGGTTGMAATNAAAATNDAALTTMLGAAQGGGGGNNKGKGGGPSGGGGPNPAPFAPIAPTAPTGPAFPNTAQGKIDSFYSNFENSLKEQWDKQQGVLQGQMSGFQREADSLNARMGGSIAGGYSSLAGSGLNKGMNAFNDAAKDHNDLLMANSRDKFNATTRLDERLQEHEWDQESRDQDFENKLLDQLAAGEITAGQMKIILEGGDPTQVANNLQALDDRKADRKEDSQNLAQDVMELAGGPIGLAAIRGQMGNENATDQEVMDYLNEEVEMWPGGPKIKRKKLIGQDSHIDGPMGMGSI
jgi:hypothetical protein